jgi:hypothetical protein
VLGLDCGNRADLGTCDNVDFIESSDLDVWGLGVVQEIDAAAMSIWVKYRNLSVDVTTEDGEVSERGGFDDFHYVGVGALINF